MSSSANSGTAITGIFSCTAPASVGALSSYTSTTASTTAALSTAPTGMTCYTGYFYDGLSNTCIACAGNAASCTISYPTTCSVGYYLTAATYPLCVACTAGMAVCSLVSSTVTATICSTGYVLLNGACYTCGTGVFSCSATSAYAA